METTRIGRCDSCGQFVQGESLSGELIEVRYLEPGGVEQTLSWRAALCQGCREPEKLDVFSGRARGVLIRAHKYLQGK